MCHGDWGSPPVPPIAGEILAHGPMSLTAADGTVFAAYRAIPSRPVGKSVIILPDVRGLHPFYEQLAERCAQAGFASVVIDQYGRTAGNSVREVDFDWRQHLPSVRPEHVDADAAAAARFLRGLTADPVFTIGFCFGGGHSWRLAASDLGLAGAIGLYGLPHLVGNMAKGPAAPLLLLLAGQDDETPAEEFVELAVRLRSAGREYELLVYENAPHSFFDRASTGCDEICADAWSRILSFIQRHGG
jgi:carboxymethylenebutenolidase